MTIVRFDSSLSSQQGLRTNALKTSFLKFVLIRSVMSANALEKYLQASTRFSRFPKIFKHSNLKIETEDFESHASTKLHELVLAITIHRILNKNKTKK